jgi:hypothetical protein
LGNSDSKRGWLASLAVAATLISALPAAAADEDSRVAAFRATCLPQRTDFEATAKQAETQGWKPSPAAAHPELKSVIEAATADAEASMNPIIQPYTQAIGGRPLYLLLMHVTNESQGVVGCYLYDFEAAEPLDIHAYNFWLGAPPAGVVEEEGNAVAYKWEAPPALPGVWEFYATFLAEGGAAAKDIGFTGLVLKITSIDLKK